MESRFLTTRRPALVVAGLIGLLVAGMVPGIDVALERLLQIVGTGVAILGLWPPRSSDQVCLRIAEAGRRDANQQLQQMLAHAGKPAAADIVFRAPSAETEPELVRWGVGGCVGTTRQLPSILQAHHSHQVVIGGSRGAGKTTTAQLLTATLNELLLAGKADRSFAQHVKAVTDFNMTGWTRSAQWLRDAKPDEVADALDSWLATQLAERHGIPWNIAHRLINSGSVMPVLDGMDEMDPRDGLDRPRASAVVQAMNCWRRPVVLICRTWDYRQVAAGHSAHGEAPVVRQALHVILEDLTPGRVRDHLTHLFPDQAGGVDPRWRPVVEAVQRDPGDHQPGLARLLRRPVAAVPRRHGLPCAHHRSRRVDQAPAGAATRPSHGTVRRVRRRAISPARALSPPASGEGTDPLPEHAGMPPARDWRSRGSVEMVPHGAVPG